MKKKTITPDTFDPHSEMDWLIRFRRASSAETLAFMANRAAERHDQDASAMISIRIAEETRERELAAKGVSDFE